MSQSANLRINPFTGAVSWIAISAEPHTIGLDPYIGLYGFRLYEIPNPTQTGGILFNGFITGGLTEIFTGTPATGQCRVDYGSTTNGSTGFVWCNSAQNALSGTVDYQGGGSIGHVDNIQSLITGFTDWAAYTPTFSAGAGTVTNINMFWRTAGDSINIKGTFTLGTTTAAALTFTLPGGFAIDTSKIDPTAFAESFGQAWILVTTPSTGLGPGSLNMVFVYNGNTGLVQMAGYANANLYENTNANVLSGAANTINVEVLTIPYV